MFSMLLARLVRLVRFGVHIALALAVSIGELPSGLEHMFEQVAGGALLITYIKELFPKLVHNPGTPLPNFVHNSGTPDPSLSEGLVSM